MKGLFILAFCIPGTMTLGQTDSLARDSAYQATEVYLENLLKKAIENTVESQAIGLDLEIDEIIVNEMISKHGNDFFDFFISGFNWPEAAGDFIIIISERPFRSGMTKVEVQVNDLKVFESFLQPRNVFLEELALYTQLLTQQYILNYQQIYMEIEGGDRSGTGIY